MSNFSVAFKIIQDRNCPLYEIDDWFVLTNQSVRVLAGQPTCLILVRELTSLLFKLAPGMENDFAEFREELFNCGGCTGLVKFRIENLPGELERETESTDSESQPVKENRQEVKDRRGGAIISGTLEEISTSELLQFFHMHQKTGKLMLHVPGGIGRIAFREGGIIGAKFEEKENKDAVFALLGEHKGRFSFVPGIPASLQLVDDIGDFMMLLMEGIKRLDESKGEES